MTLGDADGAATLAAFTVEATAAALRARRRGAARWLVCGGGRRNLALMRSLAARLGASVEPIESIGYDGDVIEAQCFALSRSARAARLADLAADDDRRAAPIRGGVFWPAPNEKGPAAAGPCALRGGRRSRQA